MGKRDSGVTHIPGKLSEDERVQAQVDKALSVIYDAFDDRNKAEKNLQAVNALAKSEIDAAEAAFEAAIEEPSRQNMPAKERTAKLSRCEQSWDELKSKRVEHAALKAEAKNKLGGAEQRLADAIAASKQSALDFGDEQDAAEDETEH